MKKPWLKLLIVVNTVYAAFAIYTSYKWDKFQYAKGSNGNVLYELQNSALIEEFGCTIYIVSLLSAIVCGIVKMPYKWLWFFIALLPMSLVIIILLRL